MNPLRVRGTLESLGVIAQYIKAASQTAGLDEKDTYRLRLAVDEIATNIVLHAYQGENTEKEIFCQAFLGETTLTIFLEDTGIPFKPTQFALTEDFDRPLEKRKIGGLGIYLAKQNLDRLDYQRVGQRNRNILVINRQTKEDDS